MKNKILSMLITILALCTCVLTLTACGENEPPHTHTYSVLKYDTENHWYECSCGKKKDIENHKGGTATETNKATCSVCNQEYGESLGHVHALHLTKVNAKPQSCTKEGNIEYYTCSCGKWFTDNTATTEITDKDSVVIEKDAHKYETLKKTATEHWWECSCGDKYGLEEHHGGNATCTEKAVCDDCGTEYGSKKSHSYTILKQSATQHWYECTCGAYETKENHIPGAVATETTDQKCTECNYVIAQALGHVHTLHLTKVNAKPQSCTKEGNTLYYTCSCGKWFTDNTATTEITDKDSIVIAKDDHKYETLKKTDTQHWYECSCGAYETKENHIPGAEATETTDQKCTVCNYVITPALSHVHTLHLTKVDAKPQSCTKEGNTLYYTCSCGKWFTDNTAKTEITDKSSVVIAKDDHSYSILKKSATQHWYECTCGAYEIKENHKGGTATCQVKATCSICDTVYGDFAEHKPKTAWVITDTHHYHECVYNCGEKLSYKEHSFTNYVSNKDATYESDGTKTAQCDGGCGKTHTVTDVGSMLIKDEIRFTTLNVNGKNVTGTVANAVERFYFADEIYLSGNANFIVSLDEDGIQSSITNSMPLDEGDNTFYVLETINGVYNQTYVITIHRNYMFTVNFMVADETVKIEQIEENQQVTAPIVQDKYGYTFDGWQVNTSFVSFPYTVTKNTTFKAIYTPIPYNVTYHIDTYDSDGVITSKTETIIYTIENMVNGKYSLKNTVKDDYVFYGWTTEKQFEPTNTILSVNELKDYVFYGYYEYGTKGVVYEKTGETYAVAGYEGVDSDFVIAVLHNGIPVTTINPSALKDNLTVESITISKYISSIGLFAFNGCKNVTQVYYAADNCQNLAEDTRAFYYLGQNKTGVTVTIADNVQRIPEHLFFAWILDTTKTYHPKLKTVQFEDNSICQEIGKRAFGWCFEIVNIEIPESIKTIGKESFSKLYYVENIYFNAIECDNVAITDKAFEDLSKHNNGVSITIGENVVKIPAGMFNGTGGTTTNIKDISFATNGALTSIGSGAFAGAKKLTKVDIPETIQNVELNAFMYCSSLTEFTVPKSVKILDLTGCTGLIDITFNNVIEELNVNGCSSLKDVTLPNTLKKVDFSYCTSIKAVELPDSVISAMFTGCSKLETMTLPAGFTEVADRMFKDCTFLQGVEFEGVITRVGDYAFSNCTTLGGSRPYTIKHIGAHAYEYTEITMFSASYNLESIGEYAFRGCSKLWDVSFINGNVKTISKYAFYNCTALKNLDIDFGVENIEEYAFYDTALTSVELPISVTKLGNNVFNYKNFDLILENQVKPSEFLYSTYYSSDTTYGNNNITSNNYSYVVHDGKAYLTKYHGSETSVTIPSKIDGYPVVALVGTYCGNSYINEVYIPESITWIDYDAFYNCNNITAFYLYADNKLDNWHDSWNHNKTTYWDYQGVVSENGFDAIITDSGAYIIRYTGVETNLVVPDTINNKEVVGLVDGLFKNNSQIESVILPDSIKDIKYQLFYNCKNLQNVEALGEITIIEDYAFNNCSSLTNVSISNSVTSIGNYAFDGCTGLTKVNYLGNIDSWIEIDFENSSSNPLSYAKNLYINNELITSITIPNSVSSISDYAFYNCSSLTSVNISNSVTSIGTSAFDGCTGLTKVNYLGNIENWVAIGFENSSSNPLSYAKNLYINNELITSIEINTATKINSYVFYNCISLTNVSISNSVTSIGNYAFDGCPIETITAPTFALPYLKNSNLKTVVINGGKEMPESAFYNCESLTSIEIPSGVTSIGWNAFYGCDSLTSVTIPNSVTSIGSYAFYGCGSLTKVNYLGNIDSWVEIDFENSSSNPLSYAGNLYIDNELITSIEINTATKIKSYAFYNCSSLTNVSVSNSVTSIGCSAFMMCSSLESISLPFIGESLTASSGYNQVFGYIFGYRTNQYGIEINGEWSIHRYNGVYYDYDIPVSIKEVIITNNNNVPKNAFGYCYHLTNITLQKNVKGIGNCAFYFCESLTSVEIPSSVTSIGTKAFYNCNSLKSVYYSGTAEEWADISTGNYNTALTNATRYYNYGKHDYTYQFNVNGGQEVADITSNLAITLPTPTKENWYFGGWYDNAEFTGTAYFTTYYSSINTTLYAKWITEEEYYDGTSFEWAINVISGESITATIDTAGEKIYYKFIPTESKSYTIKSSGGLDTYGYLYDSNRSQLAYNDGSTDFTITRSLTAGETYYIVVKMYSSSATGTFTVSIS